MDIDARCVRHRWQGFIAANLGQLAVVREISAALCDVSALFVPHWIYLCGADAAAIQASIWNQARFLIGNWNTTSLPVRFIIF